MKDPQAPSPPPSPWSVEHYGFTDHPASQRDADGTALPPAPGPSRPAASAAPSGRRPPSLRALLATAVVALGLTAGGAGFAAAQASAGNDGGRPGDQAAIAITDHGARADHGGGR